MNKHLVDIEVLEKQKKALDLAKNLLTTVLTYLWLPEAVVNKVQEFKKIYSELYPEKEN
jgi:hypothetical protein